jgi:chaperonin GroES|eukprot:COSAG02_NODE_2223_length_9455_cov_5.513675_5_plen_53_part_00
MRQGGLIPMGVAVGDKVLLPEYGGQAITLDGDDFHLFREDDILVSAISCRAL